MAIIAIMVILFIVFCIWWIKAEGWDAAFIIGGLFLIIATGAATLSLLVLGGLLFYDNEPVHEAGRWDIVAVNDTTNTSGHFGLFSGYVQEQWRYYYYYPVGSDQYRMGWVSEEMSTIVEDSDTGSGYIVDYNAHSKLKPFGITGADDRYFMIHVPKGTIVQQYHLDLGR